MRVRCGISIPLLLTSLYCQFRATKARHNADSCLIICYSNYSRLRNSTMKRGGVWVMPNFPVVAIACIPEGRTKSYLCNIEVKKRKSSILARDSPTQARLPEMCANEEIGNYNVQFKISLAIFSSNNPPKNCANSHRLVNSLNSLHGDR